MKIKTLPIRAYVKVIKVLRRTGLGKYSFIQSGAYSMRSHLKPQFVEIDGNKMFLDPNDTLSLSVNGVWEEFETECVKKIVKKNDIVIDIGANIGYYTLILAKLVGDYGKVFAFEPEPENFDILKKNVDVNGYQNVELAQKALSEKTGRLKLYLADGNLGDHRIFDSGDDRKAIEIDVVKPDEYFRNFYGKINFIKMDVQGAEIKVIKGMQLLLQRSTNLVIMTEFDPSLIKRSGSSPEEFLNLLVQNGFKIFNMNTKSNRIEAVDLPKLLSSYPTEREGSTDLLCVKGDLPDGIKTN